MQITTDIAIIGSGAGGGTIAYALRNSGATVLLLERGEFLPSEPENSSARAVFIEKRYKPRETWIDGDGTPFQPGSTHYFVGGNTKMYGACLARYRAEDFGAYDLEDGPSPAWPIDYAQLAPYYDEAEAIYRVHGQAGADFMEPPRNGVQYPFPPVAHHPVIQRLADSLSAQGLRPFPLPMGIDVRPGGRCVLSKSCDGFACPHDAKSDADVCCVRPALLSDDVQLRTRALARRLVTDPSGRTVVRLEAEIDGESVDVVAAKYVLSAGAVNSAALLLRSANSSHPNGLANSSDQVGRNYLQHMNGTLIAVDPLHKNDAVFQKTLGVNDFYSGDPQDPAWPFPLGSVQLIGKLQAEMVTSSRRIPLPVARAFAERSVDWWTFTEDTPLAENRVTIASNDTIQVTWRPTNVESQRRLLAATARMMRRAGYPLVFTETHGVAVNSHQAGTLRFGDDPATSVLDPHCRAHDLSNLYVVDGSFHPSLGGGPGGPTLTIAAMALRVAAESDLAT